VQFFFTWRIWTFCMAVCGRWMKLVVAAVCFLIVCTSICALVSAITFSAMYISPVDYPPSLFWKLAFIWTVPSAIVDVTITAIMITMLYHAKSSACFGETRDRISNLLRLTLQTGFVTSILALPIGPLYLAYQFSGNPYDIPGSVLAESYLISLLANLNALSYSPTSLAGDAPSVANVTLPQASTRSGIPSFIRSVAHTVHRDLTGTPAERTSRTSREAPKLPNREEEVPGNNHGDDDGAARRGEF